jgi:hypothetical protein
LCLILVVLMGDLGGLDDDLGGLDW